jgi:hypothetical protein
VRLAGEAHASRHVDLRGAAFTFGLDVGRPRVGSETLAGENGYPCSDILRKRRHGQEVTSAGEMISHAMPKGCFTR